MHDFYKTSAEATELILEELTNEGYRFVTVPQLIEMKKELLPGEIYFSQGK